VTAVAARLPLLVAVVLGVLAGCTSNVAPPAPPTTSTSATSAPQSPTANIGCRKARLTVAWGRGGAAMGTEYATVVVRNDSNQACELPSRGYAGFVFAVHSLASPGFPGRGSRQGAGQTLVITPGGRAYFSIHWPDPVNFASAWSVEHCIPLRHA